jgi:hypothetical protein
MLSRRQFAGLLLLAAAVVAWTGPALTKVEDTLYRADGTKFSGVAFIEWKSFDAADSTSVPSRNLSVRITDGLLRVSLVPTTNATPGAYYRVRFNSDGRTDFVEYWAVPPSSAPLRLRDVRTSGPQSTAGSTPPVNTAILITDVSGLRDELDNRPSKGGSFVPGHVVVANEDGGLDTVSGNESDCVRVDGTSGPCGGEGFRYIDAETPGGAVDGVNADFTLALAPNPDTGLSLYRNGLLLHAGVDYTVSGSQIQFAAASIPNAGDVLLAYYRLPDPFGSQARQVAGESPSGALDGTNATFVLASAPSPAASLQLYRNGLLAAAGIDYDLTGSLLVFRSGNLPQAGDSLIATYRY